MHIEGFSFLIAADQGECLSCPYSNDDLILVPRIPRITSTAIREAVQLLLLFAFVSDQTIPATYAR